MVTSFRSISNKKKPIGDRLLNRDKQKEDKKTICGHKMGKSAQSLARKLALQALTEGDWPKAVLSSSVLLPERLSGYALPLRCQL